MTIREGRKRDWVWVKLVGKRDCKEVGCYVVIKRVSWVHPRPREDWLDGVGRHAAPLPLSRRCCFCAAKLHGELLGMRWRGARGLC